MNPVIVHLFGLAVSVVLIILADGYAMSWLRGKRETLSLAKLKKIHYAITASLGLMILSGLYMFWPARSDYLSLPLFKLKLFFVGILVINSFLIGRLMEVASQKPFRELSGVEKRKIFVSGVASAIGWAGAIFLGFYIF